MTSHEELAALLQRYPRGVMVPRELVESLLAEHASAQRLRDCGQDVVCATPPGCSRHWEERNRELVGQLAEASQ